MTKNLSRIVAFCAVFLLGACALPVPFQIASLVADGVSLITTNKTVTDHGISALMEKDCSLMRGMREGNVCQNNVEDEGADLMQALALDEGEATPESVVEAPTMDGDVEVAQITDEGDRVEPMARFETAAGAANETATVGATTEVAASGDYWIIGSFVRKEDASRMAGVYGSLGPRVVSGRAGVGAVWRVAVGPHSSNDEGGLKNRIRDLGIRDAWLLRISSAI